MLSFKTNSQLCTVTTRVNWIQNVLIFDSFIIIMEYYIVITTQYHFGLRADELNI